MIQLMNGEGIYFPRVLACVHKVHKVLHREKMAKATLDLAYQVTVWRKSQLLPKPRMQRHHGITFFNG